MKFKIYPKPPFRLDLTVWALRRTPANEMDRWDGAVYRRVLSLEGGGAIDIAVEQTGYGDQPELSVSVGGPVERPAVESLIEKMLGLRIDLRDFYLRARVHQRFSTLATRFLGLKPPRMPTVFEAAVNGIACQQLSLNVGITLLNRLCKTFGSPSNGAHAFPRPSDLKGIRSTSLRKLGFSLRKADYILGIARQINRGELDLESLAGADDDTVRDRLNRVAGIGRWTTEYVMLRGLGRLDTLPGDDVGVQDKLKRWLDLEGRPDYEAVYRIIDPWRPYRGMTYFLLLLDYLQGKGLLK